MFKCCSETHPARDRLGKRKMPMESAVIDGENGLGSHGFRSDLKGKGEDDGFGRWSRIWKGDVVWWMMMKRGYRIYCRRSTNLEGVGAADRRYWVPIAESGDTTMAGNEEEDGATVTAML
ncbi:hypothetical protein ACLOJK_036932 [Asimina triloba]